MGALACVVAGGGVALAEPAALPNANLPGNSPSLPNSNLPGPVPTEVPIMLQNTDTGGYWMTVEDDLRAQRAHQAQIDADRQETLRLTAKAVEEAARARADLAESKEILRNALEPEQQP